VKRYLAYILFVSATLFNSGVFAQNKLSNDELRECFSRVDSFLIVFQSLSQFREPASDTLSSACVENYVRLFAANCLHPDLLNPVILKNGDLAYPNKVVEKSLKDFTNEVKSNFPAGLIVRYQARNYNFENIDKGYFKVVLECKVRGQAKNRWRIDLTDTLQVSCIIDNNQVKISDLEVLGFSYGLTDIQELKKTLSSLPQNVDTKELIKDWEQARKQKKIQDFLMPFESSDSLNKETLPCSCVERVPSVDQYYAATNQYVYGTFSYRNSPMIAYSDRANNFSVDAPKLDAVTFKELEFLQPFYVADTAGDYVRILQYRPYGVYSINHLVRTCLEDFGWIPKNRLLFGSQAQHNQSGYVKYSLPHRLKGHENADSDLLGYRIFQSPALILERSALKEKSKVFYVYKRSGDSVLLGTAPRFRPELADKTLLGWASLEGLIHFRGHNNHSQNEN
jgi:hypothetical protein